jgi:GNAT superfamily N-acetyltransferase
MPVRVKADSGFKIRKATLADIDDLAEQRNAMYREMYPELKLDYKGHMSRYKAWFRTMMKRKKLVSFLVTDKTGRPVAGGSVWVRENQPSPRYRAIEMPYLMSMYTKPTYRNRGIATMIVNEAIEWSRNHGYPRITLHASQMGEPVYAKLGFEMGREMRLILDSSPFPGSGPTAGRRRGSR